MLMFRQTFSNKVGAMSLNKFFLFLSTSFLLSFSIQAKTETNEMKNVVFPKEGINELKVSTPKGKIDIQTDAKAKDFVVTIKPLSHTQNKDEKKCIVETGLKGESLNISISSENILFDKATCDYDVKIKGPINLLRLTTLNSGTADIKVGHIQNELSIKTASGNVELETEGLKILNFTSATGNLWAKFKTCSSRADFDLITATGKIDLHLPKKCALRVDFKSATGKLFNSVGESKDYLLKINGRSASGDLSILSL